MTRALGMTVLLAQTATAQITARPVYAPDDSRAVILEKFGRFLDALVITDSLSGVVAIAQHGKVVLSRVSGIADERTKVPIAMDTRFTLASLGKMFTAVAIAQLVEQGKVALSDTVGKFLPDYPNRDVARRVTVEHLLTHTSGLGTYWNDRYVGRRTSLVALADYVPIFGTDPLLFTPGERWEYSNAGYIVLGRIVEAVSGMSYFDYTKRHIFERARMPNTGYYDQTGETRNGAVGYFRASPDAALRDNLDQRELRGSSAGGGYSTAPDLVAFLDALFGNRLIEQETRERFTSGKVDGPFGVKRYGYGFILRPARDTVTGYGHTGGFSGMATQAFHYPGRGYSLVVLLNRSGPVTGPVMGEASRAVSALNAARE